MKKFITLLAILAVFTICSVAAAGISPTTNMGPGGKRLAIGAYMSMGMANMIGDGAAEMYGLEESDEFVRFAGGAGAYINFYLTPMLALETGLGFLGKGARYKTEIFGDSYKGWQKVIYMEIPLAVRLNISNFMLSMGLGVWFALSGKTVTKVDGTKTTTDWGDDEWDAVYRVNFGPRINVGYAIPVGPLSLVPSITWMMHVVNDLDNDGIPGSTEYSARAMNIMFNVGAEFGI